jgi:hypothetical protein
MYIHYPVRSSNKIVSGAPTAEFRRHENCIVFGISPVSRHAPVFNYICNYICIINKNVDFPATVFKNSYKSGKFSVAGAKSENEGRKKVVLLLFRKRHAVIPTKAAYLVTLCTLSVVNFRPIFM